MKQICIALALSLLTACAASESNQTGGPAQTPHVKPLIVEFPVCATRALRIETNVGDVSSKSDLIEAWRLLTKYPNLRVKPVESQAGRNAFRVAVAESCTDQSCASSQGWERLQTELATLPGVTVACDPSLEPAENFSQQNSCLGQDVKQSLPKEDQSKPDSPKQDSSKDPNAAAQSPGVGFGNGGRK